MDKSQFLSHRVPNVKEVDLALIRSALCENPELHSYFSELGSSRVDERPKTFSLQWKSDEPEYAENVTAEFAKARLVRRDRAVLFQPPYRVNRLDYLADPVFIVTDLGSAL